MYVTGNCLLYMGVIASGNETITRVRHFRLGTSPSYIARAQVIILSSPDLVMPLARIHIYIAVQSSPVQSSESSE